MPTASKIAAAIAAAFGVAAGGLVSGCVSVTNQNGLKPPVALCSHFRASVGRPRGSVPCGEAVKRVGRNDGSVAVKEWVWSGVSADVVNMALREAAAEGGLTEIYYADYEQISYLGFVTIFNLVAYGK